MFAKRFPFVVVGGSAAIGPQCVDGRAAAQKTCLFVASRGGAAAHARFQRLPDVARVEIRAARITAANGVGHRVRGDIAARFDEAYARSRIFGKARGQHATSGAAPQNKIVEHVRHSKPHYCMNLSQRAFA